MTLEEYKEKQSELMSIHKRDTWVLAKEYAYSNNTINVGDKITDHMGTIIVESFTARQSSFGKDVPYCVYFGPCITKAGKPYKSGEKREVHQINIKE